MTGQIYVSAWLGGKCDTKFGRVQRQAVKGQL
jgi:hypothetical protein